MSEKVKENIRRLRGLTLFFPLAIILLFITLLRPASVRPEHGLGRCGIIDSNSAERRIDTSFASFIFSCVGRWPPPSHRPADYLTAENAENADNQLGVKNSPAKAGGAVGHGTRNRPPAILVTEDWLDELIQKLWIIESSGQLNPRPGDNGKAIGPLQIHLAVIKDVNRFYGMEFASEDRQDLAKSKQIARLYLTHWLNKHREEITARIWCGGPRGWRKKSTDGYWEKIQKLATKSTEETK